MTRRVPRRSTAPASVSLTSMLDVLTILLVFLLRTLDVDGGPVAAAEGLQLPVAGGGRPPEVAVMVAVADGRIRVDGREVGALLRAVDPLRLEPVWALPDAGAALDPLRAALDDKALRARALSADGTFEGRVVLAADREVPWAVLRAVIATTAGAGFGRLELLVEDGG